MLGSTGLVVRHQLPIDLLHVWLDSLAFPVHVLHEVDKPCIGGLLYLLAAIRGLFGYLRGADRVELSLVDRQVHRDQPQCHLDLPLQVCLLTTDERAKVLLKQHLKDGDGAWVLRDQRGHRGTELRVADLPSAVVHDFEALDAAQEGRRLRRLDTFSDKLKQVVKEADVSLGKLKDEAKVPFEEQIDQLEDETLC